MTAVFQISFRKCFVIIDLPHVQKINAINSQFDTTRFMIERSFIIALDSISKTPSTDDLSKALLLVKPDYDKGKYI